MASIGHDGGNKRRILFEFEGKRRTVRLLATTKSAETVRGHVEEILMARSTGTSIPSETTKWLAKAPDMHDKLAHIGLVEPRNKIVMPSVLEFVEKYMAERVDLKAGTLAMLKQAKNSLTEFLGVRTIDTVTPADADALRASLIAGKSARATVAKRLRIVRHFFEVAKRRRLITENPFSHISGSARGDASRRVFVPASDIEKVIAVCHDPQWRLLIALARYGGLRIPSEALALTWKDVDFDHRRFVVRASKTEHHEGGGVRHVPMFPELVERFKDVFDDEAANGSVHVITRYRDAGQNLRTQFERWIIAAGLKPWPKLWQNLRASRATDLAESFPSHVCAAWLGHSERIADAFYRMTTDEHFAKATSAAQNAAQQPAASDGKTMNSDTTKEDETPELPMVASGCGSLHEPVMGAAGFEPA